PQASIFSSQSIPVMVNVTNRSNTSIKVYGISVLPFGCDTIFGKNLIAGQQLITSLSCKVPATVKTSQPYWLREVPTVGMYTLPKEIP
ncbi:hypothetical protein LI121_22000, partial [Eubacterium callanderi]|uniref:hypothetical protein n=1 Tax=Eubacterium callanderi TaxID=53442 RepID=UPI001D05FD5E